MSGKTYGYARVSTKKQNEDRQILALEEYGVEKDRILIEKQSGKDFDRPIYQFLIQQLEPGDTLVITSLDRLGRDYAEVQEQWHRISKEIGASIVVLDMPLLNTRITTELIGLLISDLILGIFSFVAQTERENIRDRQRAGIDAAKARGVHFGRPRVPVPENFEETVNHWRQGEFTACEAAGKLGFSRSTFFRLVSEAEREDKKDEEKAGNAPEKPEAVEAEPERPEASETNQIPGFRQENTPIAAGPTDAVALNSSAPDAAAQEKMAQETDRLNTGEEDTQKAQDTDTDLEWTSQHNTGTVSHSKTQSSKRVGCKPPASPRMPARRPCVQENTAIKGILPSTRADDNITPVKLNRKKTHYKPNLHSS